MLVLTRKENETIVIGSESVRVKVLEASKGIVKIGVSAPPDVPVHRLEVWDRIKESEASHE